MRGFLVFHEVCRQTGKGIKWVENSKVNQNVLNSGKGENQGRIKKSQERSNHEGEE